MTHDVEIESAADQAHIEEQLPRPAIIEMDVHAGMLIGWYDAPLGFRQRPSHAQTVS
ncbi:hypothetical protein L901_18315 [Agrobacterium sp. D14]|nr:hypothetical protein L901_18315 [Agrobacterium sp. D14]